MLLFLMVWACVGAGVLLGMILFALFAANDEGEE